jgi:hypothetical protein
VWSLPDQAWRNFTPFLENFLPSSSPQVAIVKTNFSKEMHVKLPTLVQVSWVLFFAVSAFAGVNVSAPGNGSVVGSPVNYLASAGTGCSKGVASMGVYVDNQLIFVGSGATLNTKLSITPGSHNTVVEEWDYCGGASYTPVAITVTTDSSVWVTSPADGSNVATPVNYAATATSSCSKGVAAMGVYVNNQLNFVENGAKLNTSLTLTPGTYDTVVEEWDYCGGSTFKHLKINVSGQGFMNLQGGPGWTGYGEFPPRYDVCSNCGSGVTWSLNQGVQSPSLSGNAAKFSLGGTTPYADVLWTNPVIGDFSSQNLPDSNHTIIPNLHNFTYDVYFFGSDLAPSQALEFDINQYFNGMGFTWGHQCRIAGGNEFDVWDNINGKWVPTGVPCRPANNSWNHLTLEVERTWDNWLRYHSITLNGVTTVIDRYFPPFSVGNWYGVTVNYQMDGNFQQAPYTVFVDKLNLIYW